MNIKPWEPTTTTQILAVALFAALVNPPSLERFRGKSIKTIEEWAQNELDKRQ